MLGKPKGAAPARIALHSGFSPDFLFHSYPDDRNETFSSFLPLLNKGPLPQVRNPSVPPSSLSGELAAALFLLSSPYPTLGLPGQAEKDSLYRPLCLSRTFL